MIRSKLVLYVKKNVLKLEMTGGISAIHRVDKKSYSKLMQHYKG